MNRTLRQYHSFFYQNLLYPVALSTCLAVFLFFGRALKSHTLTYSNLIWNLFLAWVPYLCLLLAAWVHKQHPKRWWLLILPASIWLLFFPNAPYILTDFYHLGQRPGVPLWFDIGLIASFAWTGLFLGYISLRGMQHIARDYLGTFFSWVFSVFALCLGGLGIYLGRFSRWNSWDLLFHSKDVLKDILFRLTDPLGNLRFFGFILMYSAFLAVGYLTFISVKDINTEDSHDHYTHLKND